jgi:hypothetical protein
MKELLNHYLDAEGVWNKGQREYLKSSKSAVLDKSGLKIYETSRSGVATLSPVGAEVASYGDAEVYLKIIYKNGNFDYLSAPLATSIEFSNVQELELNILYLVGNAACDQISYRAMFNAHCIYENIDLYKRHVSTYREQYAKSAEWEHWMIENRDRYENAFNNALTKPASLDIAFRYDSAPLAYNPPWANEAEHMAALEAFAEGAYPGYDFRFIFNGDTNTSYANVIAGIPTNASHTSGKNMYLYYETIFNHEFGHVMGISHHYSGIDDIGHGNHMPPGESGCIMDRNSNQYCSACRTALQIPLDINNDTVISTASEVILSRYPY